VPLIPDVADPTAVPAYGAGIRRRARDRSRARSAGATRPLVER